MWGRIRVGGAVVLAAFVLTAGAPGPAAGYDDTWEDEGGHPVIVWVGTVATNLFYMPAKVVYATTGGVLGGLGWVITGGDGDVASGIWDPTVRGTWVLTPSMLEGKSDVHFIGP